MDLKDQIVSVVYQSSSPMSPLQIVEALAGKFDVKSNSKQVLQIISRNPKLFAEAGGRYKTPPGYESKWKTA